jgi:hypothetical protein
MEEIICWGLNSHKGIDEKHSQVDHITLKIHFIYGQYRLLGFI